MRGRVQAQVEGVDGVLGMYDLSLGPERALGHERLQLRTEALLHYSVYFTVQSYDLYTLLETTPAVV